MDVNNSFETIQNFTTDPNETVCPELEPWSEMITNYTAVHGYLAAVVCIAGIMTNLANIVTLSRPKMVSPINYMLMMIAIADLLLMASYLPTAVIFYIVAEPDLPKLYTHSSTAAWYLYFSTSINVVCHSISIWHTIAVATFRWIMLGLPKGKQYITLKSAYVVSAILVVANFCLSTPNWMTNDVLTAPVINCHFAMNSTALTVGVGRDIQFNFWLFACFGKIIPCILLTTLTILLLVIMHKAEKRRKKLHSRGHSEESKRHQEHNRTTGMLLVVVVIFLCVELPHGIMIIFLPYNVNLDSIYSAIGEIIDMVTLISFTVNFGLYTVMSRQFRNTFFTLFCHQTKDLNQTSMFRRLSTMATNVRHSISSGHSNRANKDWQKSEVSERTNDGRFLSVMSPLITENTISTSCNDSSIVEKTEGRH